MGDLEIKSQGPGSSWWTLVDPAGMFLAGPLNWDSAVDEAVRRVALSGGGTVTTHDGEEVRVVRHVPVGAPSHGAAAETRGEVVETAAGVADGLAGRASHEPPEFEDKINEIDVSALLPSGIRDSRTVKVFNQNVSAAAAVIAAAALVFGSGTVSAVTAPATRAFASHATVGSYISVGQAFIFTLALSISSALTVVIVRGGHVNGVGAFSVVAVVVFIVVSLTYSLGISGPTPDAIGAAAAKGTNPFSTVINELGVFLSFYGPIPFLSGVAAGCCAGNIVHRVSSR